jgi:hypothetical protein
MWTYPAKPRAATGQDLRVQTFSPRRASFSAQKFSPSVAMRKAEKVVLTSVSFLKDKPENQPHQHTEPRETEYFQCISPKKVRAFVLKVKGSVQAR